MKIPYATISVFREEEEGFRATLVPLGHREQVYSVTVTLPCLSLTVAGREIQVKR